MPQRYDVIVIGGGHAGAEASTMAARSGARTLLITQNLETIGQLSCNPAIGGIAKGTVVREVDALGGVMGRATDRARIQFRMLNRSKGPAVWSPRAQCDRALYRGAVRSILERQERLFFAQGAVERLILEHGRVRGIATTDGRRVEAPAVVITAGTFLRGRIHMGPDVRLPAGRAGESPSVELAEGLAAMGLRSERFKTGTPPRIDGRSVDFGLVNRQDGDGIPYWFSSHVRASHPPQRPCFATRTDARLHEIIRSHLSQSALYGGAISGRGPRYCPSIEDKIVKFPEAASHQVFLEPEGLDTDELYVNGLSTSLPPGIQLEFLRTLPGLAQVEMTRPGYAIEYDYFPPSQVRPTLEVRQVPGLFLAGQVNGTTGYEEAAGQGIVAGLNAAACALGRDEVIMSRSEAFIGVMVDDLIRQGVDEPYRLFTSRAEYRLSLRQDNALRRLLPLAERLGLLSGAELDAAEQRLHLEDHAMTLAENTTLDELTANRVLIACGSPRICSPERISVLARRPGVAASALLRATGALVEDDQVAWADIECKYGGYLSRERDAARRLTEMDDLKIPVGLAYRGLVGLSTEAREQLESARPASLGDASRVPGVSPSDLQGLMVEVLRQTTG